MEKLIEKVQIQPFGPQYVQQVADIHNTVLDGWSKSSLESDLENNSTISFVAVADGKAVAFCSYLVADDAELIFVCTHPDCKQQGIATKLLTHTIKTLPVTNIVLEVRSQNAGAISLYNKLGFTTLGIRKNFYSNPSDSAVVMEYIKQ